MGLAPMKTSFAVLQLLLLLLGTATVAKAFFKAHPPGPHHLPHHPIHHHTPPPSHAPAPEPAASHHYGHHYHASSPSHAPSPYSNRKPVAVEGVVYCKSCKYTGSETLTDAKPILGAVVKLECNNTKHVKTVEGETDKNGYFFIEGPKTVTTYGVHKCKVFLVSSPLALCNKKTNLHGGVSGATLVYEKTKEPHSYALYKVGPFAFEPPKC